MVFCFRLLVVGSDVFQQKNMVIFLCGLETRLFYDTIYLEGVINNPDASVGVVVLIRWLQSALIPFVTTQASGY